MLITEKSLSGGIAQAARREGALIEEISEEDARLRKYYDAQIEVDNRLTRKVVSFQANKVTAKHRWYKFKEGFSAVLVEHFLLQHGVESTKRLLDPFSGSGTAVFAARDFGLQADGIELLPIGQEIFQARHLIETDFHQKDFNRLLHWIKTRPWISTGETELLNELKITKGAYPPETEQSICKYLASIKSENRTIQRVLRFALLCVLETISYTRKDGQYLRWDWRSGRKQGAHPFDKGKILDFSEAIENKLNEIATDISQGKEQEEFPFNNKDAGKIRIFGGSCLSVLTELQGNQYDIVVTSPPYCNRYDYTRTYALELALLGVNEQEIRNLRQTMLSCTVENREKDLLAMRADWAKPIAVAERADLLQLILKHLNIQKVEGLLNNSGIPRMVKGYFYEMSCVIHELYRVLTHGGRVYMVNDNVRYAGVAISVDLILSNIAEELGFEVENILVLPRGKGNSSQQMGAHGREELRKCVYVWRKP